MSTRVQLNMLLDKHEINSLVRTAMIYGWKNDDPYKKMTETQKKQAARYAMERLIRGSIPNEG